MANDNKSRLCNNNNNAFLLCICLIMVNTMAIVDGMTVEEKIRDDPDLTQFYSMLERNAMANRSLELRQLTVFAPINAGFQDLEDGYDPRLILYHMFSVARTVNDLASSDLTWITAESDGHPRIWITQKRHPHHNEIYINNARLLRDSQFTAKNKDNQEQVLHKIDEVLVPASSPAMPLKLGGTSLYDPSAWEFIENYETLKMNPYRLRTFRQRIEQTKRQDLFKKEGAHTFFIPVDHGFKDVNPNLVDAKVIDGHVIPNQVLFTAPAAKDEPFPTLADADNLKVFITFSQPSPDKPNTIYVKSHTKMGDDNHPGGVVLAEIVKANIPLKNGVMHFIHKPLMVVDGTVKQFLEEKEEGPLSKFYQKIKESGTIGQDFLRMIDKAQKVTLFAPSNEAWDDSNIKGLVRDPKFKDILHMHLVVEHKLSVNNIEENNRKHIYVTPTLNPKKNLYFNVAKIDNVKKLTVEGGGVNATVVLEDIATKNGYIHIIDRVLGVPYATVYDKLRTDPMLNMTYNLGKIRFNHQLNDTTKKFTYFVPRDKAWNDARVALPSAVKKLFMSEFNYHAEQLLERHLVIGNVAYTMEQIKVLSANVSEPYDNWREIDLPTKRDHLKLYVEENKDHTFLIHWKGERIQVFRPNVECTNGIIHVIDYPFLKEDDIVVSSAVTIIGHINNKPYVIILLLLAKLILV